MQGVIALPTNPELETCQTSLCGSPLVERIIRTFFRAGGTSVLILCPRNVMLSLLLRCIRPEFLNSDAVKVLRFDGAFDPAKAPYAPAVAECLENEFVWLPWNFVPAGPALRSMIEGAEGTPGQSKDLLALYSRNCEGDGWMKSRSTALGEMAPGVFLYPGARPEPVEWALVARSGKVTDGIYSRWNRKLCRSAVVWLSHTHITPNAVTWAGLVLALAAATAFAMGGWAMGVLGAALFFLCGLFDEIDGMLARLTFQESPRGCWLETAVDYASYLLMFAGMTVGTAREYGTVFGALGIATLVGTVLSFLIIAEQRRRAAPPDKPHHYYPTYLKALEKDSKNLISRLVRTLQFLLRKGVLIHYVLLFAVLNLVPVVVVLAAVGSNVAWIVTLYFNRRLFRTPKRVAPVASRVGDDCVEGGK